MTRTVDIGHSLVEITAFSVQHSDRMAPPQKILPAPSNNSVTIFAAAPNGLSSWTEHYDGDYGSMFRKFDFGRPKLWPDGSSTDPAPVLALSAAFCVRTDPRSQSAWVLAIPADRTTAGTAPLPRIDLECSRDIVAAAIAPSERFIVGGTHGGRVRIWSTKDGRLLHEFVKQHRDVVTAVAVQIAPPELHAKGVGFIAATSSFDGTVRVWHIPTSSCAPAVSNTTCVSALFASCEIAVIERGLILHVSLNSDGSRVAAGCVADGFSHRMENPVRVWATVGGAEIAAFGRQSCHGGVAFHPVYRTVLAYAESHHVTIEDFKTKTMWDSMWRVHIPSHLCWSADGLTFLSVSDRGGIDGRRIRIVDKSATDQDDV